MKFKKEHRVAVGEDGYFIFREPTNEEFNEFEGKKKLKMGSDDTMAMSAETFNARVDLFDLLLIGAENLSDDDGGIGTNDLNRIPARHKNTAVILTFEVQGIKVDVKNS